MAFKAYHVHLTLKSDNKKTGPIPVSVTSSNTCPTTCSFKGSGCYAEHGPLALHWRAVDAGERGMPWEAFCEAVETLPPMTLWRHNAAGDLPGDGTHIDDQALEQLLKANVGKRGFTYTHYIPDSVNAKTIAMANLWGFTVNLSAESLEQADEYTDLGIGPVVAVVPSTQLENTKTPAGRRVVICPAVVRDDVSCQSCQLCARRDRESVIGFPAHGSGTKRINLFLQRQPEFQ